MNTLFDENQVSAKFFSYPSSLDTNIKEFAQEIQKQSKQYHFLEYFIKNNGYPDWQAFQKGISGNDAIAIIPFSFESQNETNGFIICRKNNNQYSFALYKKDSLLRYGFAKHKEDSLNAQQVQTVLNNLNYNNFGITDFHISDIRMLPDSLIKNLQYAGPNQLIGHFKPNDQNNGTFKANVYQDCITYLDETDTWWNPDGDACNCNGDEYFAYTTSSYTTVCVDGGGNSYYGGTRTYVNWWEGHGGGGGSPPPPPVKDSIYFKGLLNKYVLAVGHTSDSIFTLAQSRLVEYSLILTQKAGIIYPRNVKTDNDPNEITMNYGTANGELLAGELHTHQDDVSGRPAKMRCSLDIGDVYALAANFNFRKQDFVSIVEIGDKRQAIVVEDPVKAAAYINGLGRKDYINMWTSAALGSSVYWTNYLQASLNATLSLLGSANTSGIGFYQTIDANKVQFVKLNP